jgi:hypothetical protein
MASLIGKLCGRDGQSLVDIMLGLALVALAIGLAAILVYGGQDILLDRENTARARALAEEGLVAARAVLAGNWSGVGDGAYGVSFASGTWTLSGTSTVSDIFTRTVHLTTTSSDIRVVRSVVAWNPTPARSRMVELDTLVSNWKEIMTTGGDTGGGGPSGDWRNPQTLGSVDVGAGNSATDLDVVGSIVYLSTEASVLSKPDLHAFDVSNPSSPQKLDDLDVGAYALVSLDWNDGYAYGAATGVIPDLKVGDTANPGNLSLASEFNVITFVNAKSVFKEGTIVYLGVQRTSVNGEFFTVDAADPRNPRELDVFEVSADVNDIFVKDGLAYAATGKDDAELLILDAANPATVTERGRLNVSGTTDGTSVFVVSPAEVFLGVGSALYLLDATNPASVTVKGAFDAGGTINDISVAGTLAFLATSNSNQEFQAVNIAVPDAPTLWSSFNFPQVATGIDYYNNLVFVSVRSNDGLRIITSSP